MVRAREFLLVCARGGCNPKSVREVCPQLRFAAHETNKSTLERSESRDSLRISNRLLVFLVGTYEYEYVRRKFTGKY